MSYKCCQYEDESDTDSEESEYCSCTDCDRDETNYCNHLMIDDPCKYCLPLQNTDNLRDLIGIHKDHIEFLSKIIKERENMIKKKREKVISQKLHIIEWDDYRVL